MAKRTRRLYNWAALIMVVALSIFAFVKSTPAQSDLPLKLQAIAEQEINSEHETLITGAAASDFIAQHVRSSRFKQNAQERLNLVQQEHKLNQANPRPYIKAETTLQSQKFEMGSTNATAVLTALESTKLYMDRGNDPETPEYSGYELEHIFTFVNEGGEWRLENDQVIDDRTLTSPVPPPTKTLPISPSDPNPPEGLGVAHPGVANRRASDDKATLAQPQVTTASHKVYLSSIVNYAVTFSKNYNLAYHSYPDDCTNFASQALTAGGWTNLTGYYTSSSAWWYTGLWPLYNSYTRRRHETEF